MAPSISSLSSTFYSSPKANCVFLSFLTALSWSYFDLLSGTLLSLDPNVIMILLGLSLGSVGVVGVLIDPGGFVEPLRRWRNWVVLFFFGFTIVGDSITYVIAQRHVPLGDVSLFYNLSVVYTSFMDSLYRRRLPTRSQGIGLLLCLVGVSLVTQPSFLFGSLYPAAAEVKTGTNTGYFFAFLSGVSVAIGYIIIGIFKELPSSAYLISGGVADMCYAFVALGVNGYVGISPPPILFLSMASLMVMDSMGRITNLLANKSHSPTLMVLITASQTPMSYAWSWIFFGQSLNAVKIVGISLVIAAVVVVIVGNSGNVSAGEEEEPEEEEMPLKDENTRDEGRSR